jgi:hypothetical protein
VTYNPIFARYRSSIWQGTLEVSGVEVQVVSPSRPIDIEALRSWDAAKKVLAAWRSPVWRGYDPVPLLHDVAPLLNSEMASSVFASYARYAAALASFGNWSAAERHLLQLMRDSPDFVLADEVLFDLAFVQQKEGKANAARASTEAALTKNPASIRGRQYETVLRD